MGNTKNIIIPHKVLTYGEYLISAFDKNWYEPSLSDFPGETYLYKDVAKKIDSIRALFHETKIEAGDKIAICGKNSCNWAIAFLAATTYGTVAVPLLHEFTPQIIHQNVTHSDSKILFVSKRIWNKLSMSEMPLCELVVSLDDFSILYARNVDIRIITNLWHYREEYQLRLLFSKKSFIENIYAYNNDDLLVLNYTSGTTNSPKGVMIPARAVASNIAFGFEVMPALQEGHNVISLLPLAHTYGLLFEFLCELTKGVHVFFLSKPMTTEYVMGAFAIIRPKLIVMVPLLLEKIVRKRIFPYVKKPLVSVLRSIPVLRKIINNSIRRKLYNALGGNFYEIIVGGAPLSYDVEVFLKQIKYPFTVGYGMTECSPIICYSDYWDYKVGTCGKPVARMSVKFEKTSAEDEFGELLTRGANVMLGYYKNLTDTEAVLDEDGWLRTGDVGYIDRDGNICIKGRCKTMFLGANGQNIYPEEIENVISSIPFVSEVLVVQRNNNLIALVYPDYQNAVIDDIVGKESVSDFINTQLREINNNLPPYQKLAGIEIVDCEFEKTPKKSIKRFLYK